MNVNILNPSSPVIKFTIFAIASYAINNPANADVTPSIPTVRAPARVAANANPAPAAFEVIDTAQSAFDVPSNRLVIVANPPPTVTIAASPDIIGCKIKLITIN